MDYVYINWNAMSASEQMILFALSCVSIFLSTSLNVFVLISGIKCGCFAYQITFNNSSKVNTF